MWSFCWAEVPSSLVLVGVTTILDVGANIEASPVILCVSEHLGVEYLMGVVGLHGELVQGSLGLQGGRSYLILGLLGTQGLLRVVEVLRTEGGPSEMDLGKKLPN